MKFSFNNKTSSHQENRKPWWHRLSSMCALLAGLAATASPLTAATYTLGSQGENSASYPAPYGNSYRGAHHQMLVQASELNALGASAGYLTSLGLNTASANGSAALENFTIRLKQTNASSVINAFDNGGWTEVYTSTSLTVSSGWNYHTLSTGFYWDGTSNLLVDICFNNSNSSTNASMYRTATSFNSVVYFRADEGDVCSNTEITDVSALRPDLGFTIEAPMTYSYSDVRQISGTIVPGDKKAQMLRIEVVADGTYDPIKMNNLVFTTEGTTDAADLRNARVFYTGKSKKFSTDTQFGETVADPSGTITVAGEQVLSEGSNFFWLVYNVDKNAGLGHSVDAALQSLTMNNVAHTPTNSALDGARIIWPYCESTAENTNDTYIGEFSIGDVTNTSPKREETNGAAYTDYTGNTPAIVVLNNEVSLAVTKRSTSNNNDAWANVFIDWNRDGVFDSKTERVFSDKAPGGSSKDLPATYKGKFTVPADAQPGLTGVRVVLQDKGDATADPCGSYGVGETEDYLVYVAQPATLEVVGNPKFRTIGSERRIAVQLHNVSTIESLSIKKWLLNGAGAESYRVYVPGTNDELPLTAELGPNESITADIAFGNSSFTVAGQQPATFRINHTGVNAPTRIDLNGYYASMLATDEGTDLLAPGARFDVGIAESSAEFGQTVSSRSFLLHSDQTPVQAQWPLRINSYAITGADAGLFTVTTLPYGIGTDGVLIGITFNGMDATPGAKHATLTINQSGANGPISVELTGRVGRAQLQIPSFITLQPVSLGATYTSSYDDIVFVPLAQQGSAPVEITGNPVLTGSGAAMMEIANYGGRYFIKGAFDEEGMIVPASNLEYENTWSGASKNTPLVVTAEQPWLIAVRMKAPAVTATPGSYNADIVFADGMGNGISNALNEAIVQVSGEVVRDVNILPYSPVQIAFGSVPLGSQAHRTLTLRNQSGVAGNAILSITGQEFAFDNGAPYMTVAMPADNTPVQVSVGFAPTGSGSINGLLTLTGVIEGSVPLNGMGLTASPDNLQILVNGQPLVGTLDFSNVAVGYISTRTITIVNDNVGPVTLSSIGRSGANATQFSVGDPSGMIIPGNGGSITFPLQFVPTSVSSPDKNATISIYTNAGSSRTFNVRGTAVMSEGETVSVAVSPTYYNFGNENSSYEFVVSNSGSRDITISGALIIGSMNFVIVDDMSTFPRTVVAGGTTKITVEFNAGVGANGMRSASMVLITPDVTPYPTVTLVGRVGTGVLGSGGVQNSNVTTPMTGMIDLAGNFPNPFTSETSVRFTLLESAPVTLHLYNASGDEVQTLKLGTLGAGERSVSLNAQALPSGTYHYTVEAGAGRAHGVMVIVK